MNKMARRPVAIVSPEPGTTRYCLIVLLELMRLHMGVIVDDLSASTILCCRDVIEVRLSIGGVYCLLTDTAGLRSHGESGVGAIEIEGMNRARSVVLANIYACIACCCNLL